MGRSRTQLLALGVLGALWVWGHREATSATATRQVEVVIAEHARLGKPTGRYSSKLWIGPLRRKAA
jgi:hypothetical protein